MVRKVFNIHVSKHFYIGDFLTTIMGIKKKLLLLYLKIKVIKLSSWGSCWVLKQKYKPKLYVTK